MYAKLADSNYHILMIATGHSLGLIQELIHSIDEHVGDVKVLLLVIFQGTEVYVPDVEKFDLHWENAGSQLSLSAARNCGLSVMHQKDYRAHHLMFPDDDTTFNAAFFAQYPRLTVPGKAYVGRMLNLEDQQGYKAYPSKNLLEQKEGLLSYIASAGLILPQFVVKTVGQFDERLGVGAPWGSSEDVDYYLRCTKYTSFNFVRELYTFHPGRFAKYGRMSAAKIWKRFKGYSDGYYFVMYKHGLQSRLRWLPLRALGGAAVSLLKANVPLSFLYLRLCAYRLALQQKLARQFHHNPQYFSHHDES